MTRTRARSHPLFVALALVTLTLSSWGGYRLLLDYGHAPAGLAALAVGGLDIVAVLCGKHALTVAADGDSSAPWNAALFLFTGLASFAQFERASLAGDPLIIGVTMGAFPVATVLLFEGQLRRAYRLNGRAAGRLAPPRATFDFIVWMLYPRQAMQATRFAVLDRGLDSDAALMLAERELQRRADMESARPPRRRFARTYAHLLSGQELRELEGGDAARTTAPDSPDEDRMTATEQDNFVRLHGSVTAAVRAAHVKHGTDLNSVYTAVRATVPDADKETVRRTLARVARSNGSTERGDA